MTMTQKMQAAINQQIQMELSSAYLYLAMAAQLENQNLPGAAQWMRIQFKEETGHGMKFFGHMVDRGARVVLEAIEKPKEDFGTLKEIFELALAHEQKVTASIHKLYELAIAEKDYPAQVMLQWFVSEQVEEEKTAEEILVQIRACDKPHLQLLVDKHLGKRAAE